MGASPTFLEIEYFRKEERGGRAGMGEGPL